MSVSLGGDSMVHTVESNWGNHYFINRHLSLCRGMLSAKLCVSTDMFGPTMTTYVNVPQFRHEKGVSGP